MSKYDKLNYVLGKLGSNEISLAEYRKFMSEQRLTDADVDAFCVEHNAR